MYKTKFDSSKIDYLLDCDTILKYQLKSKHAIPKVSLLKFQISLKNILLTSDFLNKETYNKNIQIKAILILYLICSTMPYISFYNYKNSRFLKDKNLGDFIIKLDISNKNIIKQIKDELTMKNVLFFPNNKKIETNKILSYNFKLPTTTFQNIENYFRKMDSVLDLNKIDIQLNLVYKSVSGIKNNNLMNILKNNSSFG